MKKTPEDQEAGSVSPTGGRLIRLAGSNVGRPGRVISGLRQHWEALRGSRAVPDRVDVTAPGLAEALDYAFILERIAPGTARLRLAGRHLIDLMGMEVRGMPISALLNPGFRGRMSDVLETVFQGPQIVELYLFSQKTEFSPALPARMLLLPLKSDLGDVTRILGCLIAEGQVGVTPRRFDLVKESYSPVIAGAAILQPGTGGPAEGEGRSMRGLSREDPRWQAERNKNIEKMLSCNMPPLHEVRPSTADDWGRKPCDTSLTRQEEKPANPVEKAGLGENGADIYKGPRLVVDND